MKVLQINIVCGIKSTGRIATDIATLAEEAGHDCKIVYGDGSVPQSLQKYAVKTGTRFSNKCHAILSRVFGADGFGSYFQTKKLIKWIKEYDPDVVHLHNLHAAYMHVGVLFQYLKQAGKKVIWTLHDCWAFTGRCAHFDFCGCEKWKTGCEKCPQKNAYPATYLDASKGKYAEKKKLFSGVKDMTLVTPSKWIAELVKQSFLKEYPVKVIHNGIDVTKFKPTQSNLRERYGLQDKKIILGVASEWGERKGLKDFYRLGEMVGEDYHIVLIGVSEEQAKTAPQKVTSLPKTDSIEELAAWYTAADVFVNCTYEDTYPTVNLEAQACGTPVLTYKTGGSVESVPSDNVVEQGDLQTLVERLPQVIKNGVCMEKSFLDKATYYHEYLALYEKE